jgi:hypothetical protein
MKEDFLRTSGIQKIQYSRFENYQGETLLSNVGQYLELSGPDFTNANHAMRIKMGRKCRK